MEVPFKKFKSLHLVSFLKDICYNVKALNERLKKGDNFSEILSSFMSGKTDDCFLGV